VPEGHSLHRLARTLHRSFAGQAVASSSPQGRFDAGARLLDGRVLESAEAYGKHLFVDFEGDEVVHVHLGLYGTMVRAKLPEREPRGAVRWRIVGRTWWADLRGPTACDVVGQAGRAAVLARLGPDPLRRDADPERAKARILSSRAPMGTLLMDQSVLSGIGNIYRAELLHRHGVSPFLLGRDLPPETFDAMWDDLVVLMKDGVRRGRIVTLDPSDVEAMAALDVDRPAADDPELDGGEDTPEIRRRRRSTGVYVYRREGRACLRCGSPVAAQDHQGRRLYWCPGCQRLPGERRPRRRSSTS
jgi:endonuclease-8